MAEPLDAELLKDLRGMSKPPSFDGNDAEYQDFRFSFRIRMSIVSPCLSHVDGQVRHRGESDLPDSSESAWRCTPEMLHTDVLFTGFC